MDVRFVFVAGALVVLFTYYYLEKEISRREIFWLYSGLAILMGIVSLYYTATDKANWEYYIAMGAIFVLMASMYLREEHAQQN